MKITFHGAARTVTGSQHLLQINGKNLLLECGLFQGRREESKEKNRHFQYPPQKIDAVILSHAHIDHSGNLPNLVKNGFEGPIYSTPATAHLAEIMLLDSGHIQESDAEYVNKKKARRGEPLVEPIYTQKDAAQVKQHLCSKVYDEPFEPIPGVIARLVDAGHILGSAAIELDIEEKGRKLRLWFSGDIGRRKLPLIRDPILPDKPDYLIMECTYGDKPHSDPDLAFEELKQVVIRTINRKGKIIIPAFAVGRTQELVYSLHRMMNDGDIPSIPIIVDSPLAINASEVFRAHPECFDEEMQQFIQENKHKSMYGFDKLIYTRTTEESKALNFRKEPMVIISASGMAEAGRILHHLKNNIEDPRNTILIVSWQAPNTLGRRLADRNEEVKIFGESYRVRAEVDTIGGYSAHAGQSFLLEYALTTKRSAKKIYLVHGEQTPADILRGLMAENGLDNVYYPDQHITVEI